MLVQQSISRNVFLAVLVVHAGISALLCPPTFAQSNSYWGTYQGNAAHTGYVPGSFNPSTLSLAWQTSLGTSSLNPVTEGDGRVFVSQPTYFGNGGLHVLNASTGQEQWSTTFGRVFSVNPPAYANGMVYIQCGKGTQSPPPYLYAFNASDGTPVFRSQYSAQWERYLAPTPYAGNVYVDGGYYGGMYSFNGTTGQQNWFAHVPQYDGWTPAIDETYAYTYVGSGSTSPVKGVFMMVNLSTGTTAASVVDPVYNWTGYTMNSAVVLGTQHDAFTINGGRFVCWDTTLDATHTPHIAWSQTDNYTGQPTLANGVIYTLNGGTLSALDENTGNMLWEWWPAGGGVLRGTMVATDSILFVQSEDTTYAIDLASHKSVWSYPVSGPLALSEDKVFVSGDDGTLSAFTIYVPEPSTFALLSVCAISLLAYSWRRRKRIS
jgi:outer membrane protein assembly factor BamB